MEVLKKISEWLARETPWFITGVAVLTFFVRDAFGHRDGGEAAGLRAGDAESLAQLQAHLGQLGRLAGPGSPN